VIIRHSGQVSWKIKNLVLVSSAVDAILSLESGLQAPLENALSPKPAFSKQGAGTRIKFLGMQEWPILM
jgi:hypothetical protein